MLIFSELTTINGKYLLPFKKRAFVLGTSLKDMIVRYNGRVDLGLNIVGILDNIISIFFQLYTKLNDYDVEALISPLVR